MKTKLKNELRICKAAKYAVVSPCYRANGFDGKHCSYVEANADGKITFAVGDHFINGKLEISCRAGTFSNIKQIVGVNYSDDDRPISVIEIVSDGQFAYDYWNGGKAYQESHEKWEKEDGNYKTEPRVSNFFDYEKFCRTLIDLI